MRLYILGIGGTFMGSLAQIAQAQGHQVSGSDDQIYPPMSDQLKQAGIDYHSGWQINDIPSDLDQLIIGNALSRGHPMVEFALDQKIDYISGPQWLAEQVLKERWVLAVSGTHGKTSTSAMLAWILDYAGLNPGFLIGGVPHNFGYSARLGRGPFFVIEADEYDTAFFDKRPKFIHYHPDTLIINNIEFDHADIYANLAQIQTQFHYLIRTVPPHGRIIAPHRDETVKQVLKRGLWSELESSDWQVRSLKPDGQQFEVLFQNKVQARINWSQKGQHNLNNALSALLAARHAGVPIETGAQALAHFKGVKRRLELKASINGIEIYDDFAHHPTAIQTTLAGLKASGQGRILAVLEPRSNTMKMGVHAQRLPQSLALADRVYFYRAQIDWPIDAPNWLFFDSTSAIIDQLKHEARSGDRILIMSNGSFDQIHQRLVQALQ